MDCSTTPWRATAKSSSSTAIAASATAGCCRPARCAKRRRVCGSADAIVVNGGRALLDGALSMRLEAKSAVALESAARPSRCTSFAGTVGARHRRHRQSGALLQHAARARHRRRRDIRCRITPALRRRGYLFADDRPVLMTEKDAVKCARYGRAAALVCAGERVFRRRTNRQHCSAS